jgi:hypothetical protein
VLSKTHDLIVAENQKLEGVSTTKRIVLEVHHPYVPTIDLIDMPGMEAMNPNERTRTREILEKQVSNDKKKGNNGLYLLVVKAEGKFQVNDLASAFIDEQGLRDQCLGVFTNCDGMVPKYYPHLRTMIENPIEDSGGMVLGHGWVATMNCSDDFLDNIGSVERLKKQADEEVTFFQSHEQLKALAHADLATCTALVKRLKTVYTEYLKTNWAPRSLMLIAERIEDEKFKELTACGRKLGESEKDREAQEEVRRRLDDGLGATMDKYVAEKVQPFHSQLTELLKSVGTPKVQPKVQNNGSISFGSHVNCVSQSMRMRDVAKHVREKRQAFHALWVQSINDAVAFWDGEVEGILSAKCKLEQTTNAGVHLRKFSLVTNAGVHLRNFWDGSKSKDQARAIINQFPPTHLHKYPQYIKKLVTQHLEELEDIKAILTGKMSALEAKLFDVEQLFLKISPQQNCMHASLIFDHNVAANAVVGLLMTQGPTSDSIPGFERNIKIGDEVETCDKVRTNCQEMITKLEKTEAEIREIFPVRRSPLSSPFQFDSTTVPVKFISILHVYFAFNFRPSNLSFPHSFTPPPTSKLHSMLQTHQGVEAQKKFPNPLSMFNASSNDTVMKGKEEGRMKGRNDHMKEGGHHHYCQHN